MVAYFLLIPLVSSLVLSSISSADAGCEVVVKFLLVFDYYRTISLEIILAKGVSK